MYCFWLKGQLFALEYCTHQHSPGGQTLRIRLNTLLFLLSLNDSWMFSHALTLEPFKKIRDRGFSCSLYVQVPPPKFSVVLLCGHLMLSPDREPLQLSNLYNATFMCLRTDHLLLDNQLVCSSQGKIISLTVSMHLLIAYSSLAETPGLSLVHVSTTIVRPENVRTGIKS